MRCFGWPVNANRNVKETYASALNNGSGKLIPTLKASYAEGEGGGVELGSLLIRISLAIVTSQKEKLYKKKIYIYIYMLCQKTVP